VKRFALAVGAWLALAGVSPQPPVNDALILSDALPPLLSAFRMGFANGKPTGAGITPYSLRNPLFSDYSEKFRYAYVPAGQKISYRENSVLDFPVGSVLIKSFGYSADFRAPEAKIKMIETRLLLRRARGWVALPYVWNADGKDASLKRAGTRVAVKWTHSDGKPRAISYAVPNVNQCKDCHALGGVITLIGPKARNLSGDLFKAGLVEGVPAAFAKLPVWNDPASGTLNDRARAYLDVNCGHCHNRAGAASNSGLYLTYEEPSGVATGIGKRPVAAGRGGGGFDFGISPGHPERSILIYRLKSLDPGIAMPELGRAMVHEEGVALLSDWIRGMGVEDTSGNASPRRSP
jgi:uncharacterized repeat protein (TIGR03806 family)